MNEHMDNQKIIINQDILDILQISVDTNKNHRFYPYDCHQQIEMKEIPLDTSIHQIKLDAINLANNHADTLKRYSHPITDVNKWDLYYNKITSKTENSVTWSRMVLNPNKTLRSFELLIKNLKQDTDSNPTFTQLFLDVNRKYEKQMQQPWVLYAASPEFIDQIKHKTEN